MLQAGVFIESGRLEEAKQLLTVSLAHSTSTSNTHNARLLLAQIALKQGHLQESESHLKSVHGTSPGCEQHQALVQQLATLKPLLQTAEAALASQDWHVVKQQSQACIASIQPQSMPGLAVRMLLVQAEASAQLKQHEDALQALDLALQLQPDCKQALWQRAAAHAASRSFQASFLDLRRLSTLQPDYPGIIQALQKAAHVCSEQRRATVRATAPQRRYSRINRAGCHQQAYRKAASGDDGQSSMQLELYEVLGLSPGANSDDIRQAYKQLVARLHPDKQVNASPAERVAAEERFKTISAAYQALMG